MPDHPCLHQPLTYNISKTVWVHTAISIRDFTPNVNLCVNVNKQRENLLFQVKIVLREIDRKTGVHIAMIFLKYNI